MSSFHVLAEFISAAHDGKFIGLRGATPNCTSILAGEIGPQRFQWNRGEKLRVTITEDEAIKASQLFCQQLRVSVEEDGRAKELLVEYKIDTATPLRSKAVLGVHGKYLEHLTRGIKVAQGFVSRLPAHAMEPNASCFKPVLLGEVPGLRAQIPSLQGLVIPAKGELLPVRPINWSSRTAASMSRGRSEAALLSSIPDSLTQGDVYRYDILDKASDQDVLDLMMLCTMAGATNRTMVSIPELPHLRRFIYSKVFSLESQGKELTVSNMAEAALDAAREYCQLTPAERWSHEIAMKQRREVMGKLQAWASDLTSGKKSFDIVEARMYFNKTGSYVGQAYKCKARDFHPYFNAMLLALRDLLPDSYMKWRPEGENGKTNAQLLQKVMSKPEVRFAPKMVALSRILNDPVVASSSAPEVDILRQTQVVLLALERRLEELTGKSIPMKADVAVVYEEEQAYRRTYVDPATREFVFEHEVNNHKLLEELTCSKRVQCQSPLYQMISPTSQQPTTDPVQMIVNLKPRLAWHGKRIEELRIRGKYGVRLKRFETIDFNREAIDLGHTLDDVFKELQINPRLWRNEQLLNVLRHMLASDFALFSTGHRQKIEPNLGYVLTKDLVQALSNMPEYEVANYETALVAAKEDLEKLMASVADAIAVTGRLDDELLEFLAENIGNYIDQTYCSAWENHTTFAYLAQKEVDSLLTEKDFSKNVQLVTRSGGRARCYRRDRSMYNWLSSPQSGYSACLRALDRLIHNPTADHDSEGYITLLKIRSPLLAIGRRIAQLAGESWVHDMATPSQSAVHYERYRAMMVRKNEEAAAKAKASS